MSEQFSWVAFYEETATRLLEWESKQRELIAFLKELSDSGLPVTRLLDQDAQAKKFLLEEMDPFTFMGAFNRWISHENRLAIIDGIATFLRITSPKPREFSGVPLLNNMKSWFFPYKPERKVDDIANLWQVLRYGLQEKPFEDKNFLDAFDRALTVKNVNVNLTMGLFWSRPTKFLGLDQTNRSYLNIKLPPGGLTAKSYEGILKGTSKNAPVNDGLAMDADVLWFRRGFVGAGSTVLAS